MSSRSPATRAGFPRRYSFAPSASWTWRSPNCTGVTIDLRAPRGGERTAAADRLPGRLPRMRGGRLHRLGAPTAVPDLRHGRLLRLVAAPAHVRAPRQGGPPGDALL